MKLINILLLSFLLSSCIADSYQLTQVTPVNKTNIQIYYPHPPICEYVVLGYIEINGFYYTKQDVFNRMAEEAEKLKANAVVIGFIKQLEIKEYVATGEAIRCKSNQ